MPATITKAQEQIIETIEQFQDRVLDTNQKVATSLGERVPGPVGERLGAIPRPGFPETAAAVDSYFTFVERLTKANRRFVSEMVKVWTPESTASTPPAASEATKTGTEKVTGKAPTKKTATKKPAAKKTATKKSVAGDDTAE